MHCWLMLLSKLKRVTRLPVLVHVRRLWNWKKF